MRCVINFIFHNITWLFSGAGIAIIAALFKIIQKMKKSNCERIAQVQFESPGAIQIAGDVNL